MNTIEYVKLSEVDPVVLMSLLNKKKIREHLINHKLFNRDSLKAWITSKIKIDAFNGCKIRAILIDKELIGWCGIQFEDGNYEIAIVIDNIYWGLGIKVFKKIMSWAKELGHKTVYIHFLDTRPEYKFLRKMSKSVNVRELLGSKFTTYELEVDEKSNKTI